MASALPAFGAYVGDSLKVFLLPVTTIDRASQRNLSLAGALLMLAVLVALIELVAFAILFESARLNNSALIVPLALEGVRTFGFALISLLVMYALAVVLAGKVSLRQLFSAHLCLTGAVLGGHIIALFAKFVIGLLFLGARDGTAGGLMRLGADLGDVAIGLIMMAYGIIVMRFGAGTSWLKAVIGGLLHIALMVGIYTAYQIYSMQGQLQSFDQIIQN